MSDLSFTATLKPIVTPRSVEAPDEPQHQQAYTLLLCSLPIEQIPFTDLREVENHIAVVAAQLTMTPEDLLRDRLAVVVPARPLKPVPKGPPQLFYDYPH